MRDARFRVGVVATMIASVACGVASSPSGPGSQKNASPSSASSSSALASATPSASAPPRVIPVEPPGPPAKSAAFAKKAPAGTSGVCRIPPNADAGYPESPSEVANCPDVYELSRADGIEVGDHLPVVKPSVLPAWDLDALRDFACSYACAPVGSAAHLLAWNVIEDDRPLRNHNAVFAVEHATLPSRPKWSIVVMYRHATNQWWNIALSFHSPKRPVRSFSHAPSAGEISGMLDENEWQFAASHHGFRLLAGNVIDPLWGLVAGEPPTRFHPAAVER